MTEIFSAFDLAEYFTSLEAIAEFMSNALKTGQSLEQLYRSFSGHGNPTLKLCLP